MVDLSILESCSKHLAERAKLEPIAELKLNIDIKTIVKARCLFSALMRSTVFFLLIYRLTVNFLYSTMHSSLVHLITLFLLQVTSLQE